jgi:predicted Zn-dependent protease
MCFSLTIGISQKSYANDVALPSIGGNSAGLISPTAEYQLGRKALRQYRAYLPQSNDPYFEQYLDQLLDKLLVHSGLPEYPLSLLVIDDSSLNAFAAPGGIVGVNTGTFLVAKSEQQLVSILAHELAHLSQRHYARRVAYEKSQAPINLAALLGSILVLAAGDTDAGIAGITVAQARATSNSLAFSRDMEREADRVGLDILVSSGFNPRAMPEMFEELLKASRYRAKVPDFLVTHPVTESRVSDAKNRTQDYPVRYYPEDEEFQILRARAILHHESNAQFAVKRFTNELNGITLSPMAARYGLVRALIDSNRPEDALREYEPLADKYSHLLAVRIALADIYAAQNRLDLGLEILKRELDLTPNNHILNVRYAEVLMQASRYELGESVLSAHTKRQPENAYVWYLLAETHGLAGHILEVHKARAEYYILLGIYEKAEIQLRNAIKLAADDKYERPRLEKRLAEVNKLDSEKLN